MTEPRESLPVHARGLIEMYANMEKLTYKRMIPELVDNALDAEAMNITINKDGAVLIFGDDGIGCPDPRVMVSLGASRAHPKRGARAGRYGLGGKASCIRASQAGLVEIVSVCDGWLSKISADWAWMMQNDEFSFEPYAPRLASKWETRGTTITIHTCRRINQPSDIAADLGYLYMDPLARGVRINFKVDGQNYDVRAYEPPPAKDRIDFEFPWRGLQVNGYCILVDDEIRNPHPGWSIHWGPHRILGCYEQPADGCNTSRLQGHVYMPSEWGEVAVNMTKDAFAEPPEDLFDLIGQHCERIIKAADKASISIDLEEFTCDVVEEVNAQLQEVQAKVKGRRPGSAGKEGTAISTGNGSPHKKFSAVQPGDKAIDKDLAGRIPQHFKLGWDKAMDDQPWRVVITGRRSKMLASITLNELHPGVTHFKGSKDVKGLASFCYLLLSNHLGNHKDDLQKVLPSYEDMEIEDVFNVLSGLKSATARDLMAIEKTSS